MVDNKKTIRYLNWKLKQWKKADPKTGKRRTPSNSRGVINEIRKDTKRIKKEVCPYVLGAHPYQLASLRLGITKLAEFVVEGAAAGEMADAVVIALEAICQDTNPTKKLLNRWAP